MGTTTANPLDLVSGAYGSPFRLLYQALNEADGRDGHSCILMPA
jgi:hypothetical protein